ncbi:hypothetical protein D3C85_1895130 [compost metagenome]
MMLRSGTAPSHRLSFTLLFDFIVEIGIRKAEFLHDVALKRLHLLGFLVLDMVIT